LKKSRFEVRVLEEAQEDILAAQKAIFLYFEKIEDPSKGIIWADDFVNKLEQSYEILANSPLTYPICSLYPLEQSQHSFHYFKVMWYLVFYIVESKVVKIIRVISDKADLSTLLNYKK